MHGIREVGRWYNDVPIGSFIALQIDKKNVIVNCRMELTSALCVLVGNGLWVFFFMAPLLTPGQCMTLCTFSLLIDVAVIFKSHTKHTKYKCADISRN